MHVLVDVAAIGRRGCGICQLEVAGKLQTLRDRGGAVRVVVPGIFPFGCSPISLQYFKYKNSAAYDNYGCLKPYNDVLVYHDANLQKAFLELGKKYPAVRMVYGDLYNSFLYVLDDSSRLGRCLETLYLCEQDSVNESNVNEQAMCGDKNFTVCANPDEYKSWDGVCMTQQTYKYMAQRPIRAIFPKLFSLVASKYSMS